MAWFSVPTTKIGLVEEVQLAGKRVGDCWSVKVAELVGQAMMQVLVPVRKMRRD